jgi:MFS family permease
MTFALLNSFRRFVQPNIPAEEPLRSTIFHLIMDMAWMGVVQGTIGAFLIVYATRLGATDSQVGMLNAAPALVNIIFALPSGRWMRGRSLSSIAFWSAAAGRFFYLPLIFLPLLFSAPAQVNTILFSILLMGVPLTILNVSFTAMFAEVVPNHQRAYVVGARNAVLSITSLVFTLGSGRLLSLVASPLGYQIVFGVGIIGAILSTIHLFWIKNVSSVTAPVLQDKSQPRITLLAGLKTIDRRYLRVVSLLFCFHIAQWLVIPVNPLLAVHKLKLNDFQISLGGGLFSLVTFLVSFQVARVINRVGNHRAAGYGMIGLSLFPLILSLAKGADLFIVANLVGGVAWAVLAVALLNYLYENSPEQNKSVYMSYYILASNAAILIGSLVGPLIASLLGYSEALALFAVLRALSGIAVLIWG